MAAVQGLLKTFVHVSDLHIGDIDPRSGDARVSPAAGYAYQNLTYLDGLLGHQGRALRELEEFCAQFTERREQFELVVTGDFTRCGGPSEIATARAFLGSSVDLNPPAGNLVGLRLGAVPVASITGNHDQWGGLNRPWGGGPLAAGALVPSNMPFVLQYPLANGRRLLLAGVDTDADINPRGMKRVLAMGSFQNQLVALDQKLPRWQPGDIRVLMSHHSMARKGLTLRMDAGSKAALSVFLADSKFSILLSGHTHEHLFSPFGVTASDGTPAQVEELTCGSTTQHDQVPYSWRSFMGKLPTRAWPANTLLVHRIIGTPGATTWETEAWVRTSGGFRSLGAHGQRRIPL
jgi:DNA repair exonuclease SbcCD nuclease subunit